LGLTDSYIEFDILINCLYCFCLFVYLFLCIIIIMWDLTIYSQQTWCSNNNIFIFIHRSSKKYIKLQQLQQELSSCWDGRPFGRDRHGPKSGEGLLWGTLGHHLTQCGLGWGLPLYQVASWFIQPFGHNC